MTGKPTNMREYRKRSERNLLIGAVLIFVIVGSVLIGVFYDWTAIFTSLTCLLPGVGVLVLLWFGLNALERARHDK
ncbi:MAG: hypothetical protein JW981_04870 [Anaerolineae bacterium]|nr:hypothetical protein [Anaerolineae bacterium]